MSDEDNIFREVEDDLRRERYERLWKKYGSFVIGTVVVVLVSMIGWQQWLAWQDRQRANEAEAFLAAVDLLEDNKEAAAANAFSELAKDSGTGYRTVARLHEAQAHLEQGHPDQALAAFEAVAADVSANPKLRGLAALKGALLLADSTSPEDLRKRLAQALRPSSPWRFAAQELVAYAHYRTGQVEEARTAYQGLVNEYNAPSHIRERARSMLGLITSEQAQRGEETPQGESPESSGNARPSGANGAALKPEADTGAGPDDEAADGAPAETEGETEDAGGGWGPQ